MSGTTTPTSELTSQYSTQVAGDLARNVKEQERLTGEVEALQAQLTALRNDHTVLVKIEQALGTPSTSAPPVKPRTATPTRRKRTTKEPSKPRQTMAKKSAAKKSSARASASPSASPTLVSLVRTHLARQSAPRSAAEIATALGTQHPERTIKTTVVRTTLEGLVAKAHAQRTKQGSSVFYTAPDTTRPKAHNEDPPS
ncbi:hypothetical protein SAMN05216489_00526 [Streptomyces sp. 3213]|uniref:hypothetical protein n=1 Tax=Streptomyces sp. 3213.3 TaxID=1855348 RepID=UPI00089B8A2A|nr:hypothetical protein [Streptomyces sp. 3213.3]SEC35767.1 hypothetical protein SAMN05216489_00526 [Streptomyces sp. 3213] [Streptomyces sp. 3213.3]